MLILCGTDFTAPASQATDVAAALAAHTKDALVLVHVLDEHGHAESAGARLQVEVDRLHHRWPELRIETRLEWGFPDEVLAQLAERLSAEGTAGEQGVRLVVVGAVGRRNPLRWALGSVAERLGQASTLPLLVVRDPAPWLAWAAGERPLRLVVAYDFSETGATALTWASALTRLGACQVAIGHISWPPAERRRQRVAADAAADLSALELRLRNDLAARIRKHPWPSGLPTIYIQSASGRRATHLARLVGETEADLLIVGSRQLHGLGRLWHESVSRGALHDARSSVAIVPLVVPAGSEAPPPGPSAVGEDQADLVKKLESHPFLRGVSGDVTRSLASISREEHFPRGALMLSEGAQADALYLLLNGLVALELNLPGPGATRLESLRGGDIAGLSWFFPPYRWHLDGVVIEPVDAISIDAVHLRTWMNEDPRVGHALAIRLVNQLYERLERVRMQRLDLYRKEPR